MKILITGSNGLLGQKLLSVLTKDTNELYGIDLADKAIVNNILHQYECLNLTNTKTTIDAILGIGPDIIIHTAATTAVDNCEQEKELCWNSNVLTTENIIKASKKTGSKVIFISSDYVFDGKNGPYSEEDLPNPINYYGRSKLAAENMLRGSGLNWTIVRTIVLYGIGINTRSSFVTWLLRQLRTGNTVQIVNDQWGNTTIVDDLATGIERITMLDRKGIYNIASHDYMNRYEFAVKIAEFFDLDCGLISSITTSSLNQPADRPLRSGLKVDKAEKELYISFRTLAEALTLYKKLENN
ncbi:MAG: SDR family oxidoreductase [Candidatus Hatepunaea meridiana]|nr:SDR family oxidoreductase [Candidatus Hatepunaea meridiana]